MRVMGATLLNAFSGADQALFEGLRARKLLAGVMEGQLPQAWKAFFLLTSFRPEKRRWYFAWHRKMVKNPPAFRARTRLLDKRLRSKLAEFDIVLQVGGLFAPFRGQNPKPLALFCDYTTKLAERNYRPWFQLTKSQAAEWYDLETRLYQSCAVLFTASENTRSSLLHDYSVEASRVRVVGEGVDAVHEHPGKSYNESTVLFVGIDFERKGGPVLLRAFAQVKNRVPAAKLIIVGPRACSAQEGVLWLGHVTDRKQLSKLFSEATVGVLPSICEPFGLSLIEAMAHGLPVIGSSRDAMPEIIDNGRSGYLVDAGDSHALAERLIELLSSPELCARLGSYGRARVTERFLWNHVVGAVEAGLRDVCAG